MSNRQRLDAGILHPEALKLKAFLEERMVDQRRAIEAVVVAYNRFLSPLWEPNKPLVSMLGMGPSGAGKTFLAELMALYFFEDDRGFTKVVSALTMRNDTQFIG
ncbi:MAG: hypothetical protein Q7R94_03030 [bacterium]|nr:hypothetical protein [bacterium]